MKYKLLCSRCNADKKAFTVYKNKYNNGKCLQCNGHGYILTDDELKAKESHIKYLDVLKMRINVIELESKKEIETMKVLQDHKDKFKFEELTQEEFNNRRMLRQITKESEKSKEKAIKEHESAYKFYIELLQPVE